MKVSASRIYSGSESIIQIKIELKALGFLLLMINRVIASSTRMTTVINKIMYNI